MTSYMGNVAIPGLSDRQVTTVEQICKLLPPIMHDGVLRNLAAALTDPPPWSDAVVNAAVIQVLTDIGVTGLPALGDTMSAGYFTYNPPGEGKG